MKTLLTAGLLLAASAAYPAQACTQPQLAGTWTAETLSLGTGGHLLWITCTLDIGTAGGFTAGTSACLNSSGQRSEARGTLKVFNAANCAFSGTVNLVGYQSNLFVRNLTLSMDHNVAAGVGGGGEKYGSAFSFNMVKVK